MKCIHFAKRQQPTPTSDLQVAKEHMGPWLQIAVAVAGSGNSVKANHAIEWADAIGTAYSERLGEIIKRIHA